MWTERQRKETHTEKKNATWKSQKYESSYGKMLENVHTYILIALLYARWMIVGGRIVKNPLQKPSSAVSQKRRQNVKWEYTRRMHNCTHQQPPHCIALLRPSDSYQTNPPSPFHRLAVVETMHIHTPANWSTLG